MKIYNALSKSFTDEVKTKMGGGESIDDAFNEVKNKYEYVDLGFPVNWATRNIGADNPEDPGYLFQWGRTKGCKSDAPDYSVLTSEHDYRTFISEKGYEEGNTLAPSDDAAHVNMGGKWRMPTKEDFTYFIEHTDKTPCVKNKTPGITFASTIEGYKDRSIFIPHAEKNWDNNTLANMGSSYYLWLSDCDTTAYGYVGHMRVIDNFESSLDNYKGWSGFNIRGVFDKENKE